MGRHQARRDKLRRGLKKAGAEALLVTDFTNVGYLTGFTGEVDIITLGQGFVKPGDRVEAIPAEK